MKIRKHLSASGLFSSVRQGFAKVKDTRAKNAKVSIKDALSSNAPHIRELERHNMRYILGAKESDHTFIFNYVCQAEEEGHVGHYEGADQ